MTVSTKSRYAGFLVLEGISFGKGDEVVVHLVEYVGSY